MVSEIASESRNAFWERIQVPGVLYGDLFGKRRIEFGCGDKRDIAFAYFFGGDLIDF